MIFTLAPRKTITSFNTQGEQMERVMHKLDDTTRLSFLTEQTWHKNTELFHHSECLAGNKELFLSEV
jgi:hypothetical protein